MSRSQSPLSAIWDFVTGGDSDSEQGQAPSCGESNSDRQQEVAPATSLYDDVYAHISAANHELGQRAGSGGLIGSLDKAIEELTAEHLSQTAESLAKGLRSLRRVGLQQEAAELLNAVIRRASGRDIQSVTARVAVAGGLSGVGAEADAIPILDEAIGMLDGDFRKEVERLRLVRTLAIALSSSPRPVALERLPKLSAILSIVSDSYNTNSHFCLSVLNFAESVVLGYADSNLALGATARRWLDDAEYLVRRRVHAESAP